MDRDTKKVIGFGLLALGSIGASGVVWLGIFILLWERFVG